MIQQWFGYCLTKDTRQQKMLFLVGKTRSGKGTIATVLQTLLGNGATSMDFNTLGSPFGKAPLLDRQLAILGDVRLGKNTDRGAATQDLLSIIGRDEVMVNRKNQSMLTVRLDVKFLALCNELPDLYDDSGALLARYMFLEFPNSFLGREDLLLSDKLVTELPQILKWAIAGWKDLQENGFATTDAHDQYQRIISWSMGGFAEFAADHYEVEEGSFTPVRVAYAVYQNHCALTNQEAMQIYKFSKKLRSIVLELEPGTARIEGKVHRGFKNLKIKLTEEQMLEELFR